MPLITGEITQDGAVIDVLVGVSFNRQRVLVGAGLPVPPKLAVRAMVDTGSFASAFMPIVFKSLEIQPFRTIPLRTPSTRPGDPWSTDQYDVGITLVSGMTQVPCDSVHVICSEDFDPEEGVHALIGRDVLARCVFSYFGHDQKFRLDF